MEDFDDFDDDADDDDDDTPEGACPCTCCKHNRKYGYSGFGRAEAEWERVDRFIGRAIVGQGSVCSRCGIVLALQLVTPCAHLYCPECLKGTLTADGGWESVCPADDGNGRGPCGQR